MNAVVNRDPKARSEKSNRRHNLKFAGVLVGVATTISALMLPIVMYNNKSETPRLIDKQRSEMTLVPKGQIFEIAQSIESAGDCYFNRGAYEAAAENYRIAAKLLEKAGRVRGDLVNLDDMEVSAHGGTTK